MRSISPLAVLFATTYAFYLTLIARHYLLKLKRSGAAKTFNFRITDIWAAMVGLAPTIATLIAMLEDGPVGRGLQTGEVLSIAAFVGIMAGGQVVGLIIGRIHIELPPHSGAQTAMDSAISIVTGALIGLFLPILYFTLAAIFFAIFGWTGAYILSGLGILLCAYGFYSWLHTRLTPPDSPSI